MNTFSYIFLIALALHLAVHLWLDGRHLRHVRANRAAVPLAFAGEIPLSAHQKAADYTTARLRFGFIETVASAAVLLAWTLGGGFDALDRWLRGFGGSELSSGVAFIIGAFILMAIIDLPAQIYRTFVIEQRFGFNRTDARTFVMDLVKAAALMLVLGAPLAALVLWLMQHSGPWWWFYVWLTWTGFSLLMLWAFPVFIAPLFNKFEPLQDNDLVTRIGNLLARTGFKSNGVFVMDGSRRSAHGNAYFTGFGTNKRIVFFDTLLRELNGAEIEAVLAHELGHFKRRHVLKRIVVMALTSLIGLAVLGWLIKQPWFYSGLGMSTPSVHAALVLFLTVAPIFTFLLQPMMSRWSRQHEFEADEYAVRQSDGQSLITALVKLYKENANTLTPDPIYSAYHDSHPPAPIRVAHVQALMQ
ncbi:MAG: M48 family metallopeptidase [Gammaproteobacteria bacterium]